MEPNRLGHPEATRRLLSDLVQGRESFDLLRAALLVAAAEYPELEVDGEIERVRYLGRSAAGRVRTLSNPFARLDAVRAYVFEELGFRGDQDDFDDPRNCFLNQVLRRRRGIPLTLSILFIEIARAAGFQARGIGLPGHFVAAVTDQDRDILVDPFHGGHVITEEDCRQLVSRSTGRPSLFRRELLAGASEREILQRMLANLKRIYLAREDHDRALHVVESLLAISPGDAREIRDRGLLLAHLGEPGAAMAELEAYLTLEPAAPDAASVRGRLAWLRRRMDTT